MEIIERLVRPSLLENVTGISYAQCNLHCSADLNRNCKKQHQDLCISFINLTRFWFYSVQSPGKNVVEIWLPSRIHQIFKASVWPFSEWISGISITQATFNNLLLTLLPWHHLGCNKSYFLIGFASMEHKSMEGSLISVQSPRFPRHPSDEYILYHPCTPQICVISLCWRLTWDFICLLNILKKTLHNS